MAVLFALCVTLLGCGIWIAAAGIHPIPDVPRPSWIKRLQRRLPKLSSSRSNTRLLLVVVGVIVGFVMAAMTQTWVLVVLVPMGCVGVPLLLARPKDQTVEVLAALQSWTNALAGTLRVGTGLEQAIEASAKATPQALVKPNARLIHRLRSRVPIDTALDAWADEIDLPAADMVAGSLKIAARQRAGTLSATLTSLAVDVGLEARSAREIHADQTKPATEARVVSIISLIGIIFAFLLVPSVRTGYSSITGQIALTIIIGLFFATLVALRMITRPTPTPRFLTSVTTTGRKR